MMNSSFFLLYCLLTLSLYSISQHTCYSLDFMPPRKLIMSAPVHGHEYPEIQVAVEAIESNRAEEDFMTLENTGNRYTPHDLIYHTDYHGVTTHPTPKHPKP